MKTPAVEEPRRAVGHRVAARRASLGYSRDWVAARAGMSPSYLEYVEDQAGQPSAGVLRRLAETLHTTVEQLYGETTLEPELSLSRNRPLMAEAGREQPEHVVARLTPDECRLLMGSVAIGRVAFVVNGPPLVLPVNFTLMGNDILIQTAGGSPLAEVARSGRLVSFEVDDIDEPYRLGWSVLCHGRASLSAETGLQDHHVEELVRPWIGGDRRTVVVITSTTISGRRIGLA